MKVSDWTEADRAVRLDEIGHEYEKFPDYENYEERELCWQCLDCKPNRGPYETLRECQDACLEREIEARCGEDGAT